MTEQVPKWKLIGRTLPKIGKPVLLLRGCPDGFFYLLIGKLRRRRKEFDIAVGMEYGPRVPVFMITAWCEIQKFDAMKQYRELLCEISNDTKGKEIKE